MAKHHLTARKIGRRLGWYTASWGAGLAGHLGIYGVLVGDGKGYIDKTIDGYTAAPRLAEHYYGLYKDLDRVLRINNGFETITTGTGSAWEALKQFDISGTWDGIKYGAEGIRQTYNVINEIELSAIWHGLVNAAGNIMERPIKTVVAAAAVYGTFSALKHMLHLYATRGQGDTIIANAKRSIGNRLWSRYFNRHPEDRLVYAEEPDHDLHTQDSSVDVEYALRRLDKDSSELMPVARTEEYSDEDWRIG